MPGGKPSRASSGGAGAGRSEGATALGTVVLLGREVVDCGESAAGRGETLAGC